MRKALLIPFTFFAIACYSQSNYAVSLNGTNQYAGVGAPISTSSSYTKEAWIYATTASGDRNIISSLNAPFFISSGILYAGQAGSFLAVTDPIAIPTSRWVHVAVTYDAATTTMRLYRDGALVSTNSSVAAYTSETTYIGSHQGSTSFFQGNIDEARIWNIVLTQVQIKQYMYKGPANNASGLVEYYKCNDGSGTTLTNATGGTNGTLQNSPAWVASPVKFSSNALDFDGTNDIVTTPLSISNMGAFTLEGWIYPRSAGTRIAFFGQNDAIEFGFSDANTITCYSTGGNSVPWAFTSGTFPFNTWHHVAYVADGTTVSLYVDGQLKASGGNATGNYGSSADKFNIGAAVWDLTGNQFNGMIDEVRVWNVARTQTQIQNNMNAEIDPATNNNLLAYYTFNQGITAGTNTGVTIATDQKGTNNGTITNFSLAGSGSNFVAQNGGLFVLPLQWLSFTAQKQADNVLLKWSTATEQNTKDFIVQQSINGRDWNDITILPAAGNSTAVTNYSYLHSTPVAGINYYRVLYRDIDNKNSFSEIRSLSFTNKTVYFTVLTNPVVNNKLQVQLNTNSNLSLFSLDGQMILSRQYTAGTITIDISKQAKGIYLLKANNQSAKILLQ